MTMLKLHHPFPTADMEQTIIYIILISWQEVTESYYFNWTRLVLPLNDSLLVKKGILWQKACF